MNLVGVQLFRKDLVHQLMSLEQWDSFEFWTDDFQVHLVAAFATITNDFAPNMFSLELIPTLFGEVKCKRLEFGARCDQVGSMHWQCEGHLRTFSAISSSIPIFDYIVLDAAI